MKQSSGLALRKDLGVPQPLIDAFVAGEVSTLFSKQRSRLQTVTLRRTQDFKGNRIGLAQRNTNTLLAEGMGGGRNCLRM